MDINWICEGSNWVVNEIKQGPISLDWSWSHVNGSRQGFIGLYQVCLCVNNEAWKQTCPIGLTNGKELIANMTWVVSIECKMAWMVANESKQVANGLSDKNIHQFQFDMYLMVLDIQCHNWFWKWNVMGRIMHEGNMYRMSYTQGTTCWHDLQGIEKSQNGKFSSHNKFYLQHLLVLHFLQKNCYPLLHRWSSFFHSPPI